MEVNSKGDQEQIASRKRSRVAPSTNILPFKAKIQPLYEPVEAHTRSCTVYHKYATPSRSRALEAKMLTHAAYYVLYNNTGTILNYGQLRKHPKYQETWNKSFSNEMGRLCQGVGKGENVLGKRSEGKNSFMSSVLKAYQRTV